MRTTHTSGFRRSAGAAALLAACLGPGATAAASSAATGIEELAAVRSAAEGLLRAELREVSAGVHVTAAPLDPRLHLRACPSALTASRPAGSELGARVTVRVSCPAALSPWAVYVPVNIESDIGALVLKESAVRGARLSTAQLAVEPRRVPGLAVGYVTDAATLARHTLARSLPAGTVLTADALLADLIVRQGQEVTLIASAPGVSVRANGKVLEDGREGARVRVQNLASLKVVEGVVDASGVIEITP